MFGTLRGPMQGREATVGPRVHIGPSAYPPIACRNRESARRAVGSARSRDTGLPMLGEAVRRAFPLPEFK